MGSLLLVVITVSLQAEHGQDPPAIPESVQKRYDELSHKYGQSLGAILEHCASKNQVLFVVTGSGGFTAETDYYDPTGKKLARHSSGDVQIGRRSRQPPFDLREFECRRLKSSRPGMFPENDPPPGWR